MTQEILKLAFKFAKLAYDKLTFENKETDTQVFIDFTNKVLTIAFRGSSSWTDWRKDLKRIRKQTKSGKLHSGFLQCYTSVRKLIKQEVDKALAQGCTKIVITGHSLGGALAQLAYADLYTIKECRDMTECITFGAPRVGNKTWWKNLKGTAITLIENVFDIVPKVPIFGYFKPKQFVIRFCACPVWSSHGLSWHDLDCYGKYVDNYKAG